MSLPEIKSKKILEAVEWIKDSLVWRSDEKSKDKNFLNLVSFRYEIKEGETEHLNIQFCTKIWKYSISLTDYFNEDHNYIGCTVSNRDTSGGRDLPDGKLNKKTWDEIIKEILQWEIVEFPKEN